MHASLWVPVCVSTARTGYRLKASPDQDSMKVLYYIEKELAQFPNAKMAAFKRKPVQSRPVCHVCGCVAVFMCLCFMCMV